MSCMPAETIWRRALWCLLGAGGRGHGALAGRGSIQQRQQVVVGVRVRRFGRRCAGRSGLPALQPVHAASRAHAMHRDTAPSRGHIAAATALAPEDLLTLPYPLQRLPRVFWLRCSHRAPWKRARAPACRHVLRCRGACAYPHQCVCTRTACRSCQRSLSPQPAPSVDALPCGGVLQATLLPSRT